MSTPAPLAPRLKRALNASGKQFAPAIPAERYPILFGMKRYPAPLWKPFMPYLVGGIMTYYLFKSIEDSMMQKPEWKYHPANPNPPVRPPPTPLD